LGNEDHLRFGKTSIEESTHLVRNLPKAERKTTTKTGIKQTNISIKKKKNKRQS